MLVVNEHSGSTDPLSQFSSIMDGSMQQADLELALSQLTLDDPSKLGHPIIRCPDDILRNIFEIFINTRVSELHKFKWSVRLSGVCRQWRTIAVDTPHLWNTITLDLEKSPEVQAFLCKEIIPRVKHVPTYVTVGPLDEDTFPALNTSGIYDIPVIERLSLSVSTPNDAALLVRPEFNPPHHVQALRIWSKYPTPPLFRRPVPPAMKYFNIFNLIARFPSINEVSLRGLDTIVFPPTTMRFNITEAHFHKAASVNLIDLLTALPKVESVTIENTRLLVDDIKDARSFPSVKKLKLKMTLGMAWVNGLTFPRLKALEYDVSPSPMLLNFLSQHPSINELHCLPRGDAITELAKVVPQVEALSIVSPATNLYRPIDGGPQILFPSLKSLTILITVKLEDFTLADFDALVRTRFLPMEHPKSLVKRSSNVIPNLIIERRNCDGAPVWYSSHLYKQSRSTIPVQYDTYEEIHLTWI